VTGMTRDEEHLRLLAIFHYVLAALAGLFSLFPLIHVTIGVLMLSGRFESPNQAPDDRLFGWMFIAMGSAFMAAGLAFSVCLALAGRYLSQRRHYMFCLVMACIECMFMPFGTVLGVLTIITLQKQPVRQLFAPPPSYQ
jgi:hypothetical protein